MMKAVNGQLFSGSPIPARSGVGLKAVHYREILETEPDIGWFEVHPENYMGAGGPPHKYLSAIRETYPLSFHSVGMSLGSAQPPSKSHLASLRELIERYHPALVSDHVSWSCLGGAYYNDLLPVPYTRESLNNLVENISAVQDYLGRQILVENPSTYLAFKQSDIPEADFLLEVAKRSGCGLLLDVNNVYVSACNQGFDAVDYLSKIPGELVGEIHLAGHTVREMSMGKMLIDDHGSRVIEDVWSLYRKTKARMPHVPVLIEWDTRIPELRTLIEEAQTADRIVSQNSVSEISLASLA